MNSGSQGISHLDNNFELFVISIAVWTAIWVVYNFDYRFREQNEGYLVFARVGCSPYVSLVELPTLSLHHCALNKIVSFAYIFLYKSWGTYEVLLSYSSEQSLMHTLKLLSLCLLMNYGELIWTIASIVELIIENNFSENKSRWTGGMLYRETRN